MTNKLAVECVAWKPFERNTLKGFATVRIPALRMLIHDVTVYESHGKRWAGMPSKPMLDKDRNLVRDGDGKLKYARVFEFETREVSDAFSAAVVQAVQDHAFRRDFALEEETR